MAPLPCLAIQEYCPGKQAGRRQLDRLRYPVNDMTLPLYSKSFYKGKNDDR